VYEKIILREARISKFIQFMDSMTKKNSQAQDSEKLRWCNDNRDKNVGQVMWAQTTVRNGAHEIEEAQKKNPI